MALYLIIALLFAVAVAVFAVSNTDTVTVNFIFNQLRTSLALVILGSAAAGALAIGIVGAVRQIGLSLRIWDRENRSRRFEKQAVESQQKLESMQSQVDELQAELQEAEAYAGRLEELLRQQGVSPDDRVSSTESAAEATETDTVSEAVRDSSDGPAKSGEDFNK